MDDNMYWLEELKERREIHAIFDYLVPLNFEEYNQLEDYLNSRPEFKEWSALKFKLDVLRKVVIRHGKSPDWEEMMKVHSRVEELGVVLRDIVKDWWATKVGG